MKIYALLKLSNHQKQPVEELEDPPRRSLRQACRSAEHARREPTLMLQCQPHVSSENYGHGATPRVRICFEVCSSACRNFARWWLSTDSAQSHVKYKRPKERCSNVVLNIHATRSCNVPPARGVLQTMVLAWNSMPEAMRQTDSEVPPPRGCAWAGARPDGHNNYQCMCSRGHGGRRFERDAAARLLLGEDPSTITRVQVRTHV